MSELPPSPATPLARWHRDHGRHDLPWQIAVTPYRVWVSEIMLQQTQVATVVGYFERFMLRFPELPALADAHEDEVLHLWSGLGYYSRARNLRKAARIAAEQHGGELPRSLEELMSLPGIGRSTAGAILSLACGQSQPILDGNVKRVLSRYVALEGWPGEPANMKTLWAVAQRYTPAQDAAVYTQAIMDLGATVCTRRRPLCTLCPLRETCVAFASARTETIPAPRPARKRPLRKTCFLVARDPQGHVLLTRRPSSGVWGGLWCFPEIDTPADAARWCLTELGTHSTAGEALAPMRHGFTHFELEIRPHIVDLQHVPARIEDQTERRWFDIEARPDVGLAAPVTRLLETLAAPLQSPTAG